MRTAKYNLYRVDTEGMGYHYTVAKTPGEACNTVEKALKEPEATDKQRTITQLRLEASGFDGSDKVINTLIMPEEMSSPKPKYFGEQLPGKEIDHSYTVEPDPKPRYTVEEGKGEWLLVDHLKNKQIKYKNRGTARMRAKGLNKGLKTRRVLNWRERQ